MRLPVAAALLVAGLRTASADPLPEDLGGRRAVRGAPVESQRESEELRELRRFEEESFPRATVYLPLPGEVSGEEGGIPEAPAARPSAETPPAPLRSPDLVSAAELDGERTSAVAPAIPWLAGLKLPDLPIRWDPRLIRYLEFYKSDRRGRAIIASWLRRQGRYRALIEEALTRYKLPQALLYVSMIESGYDPQDRSSAGAAGLWQFMPDGGRIYGLRIDHWVDERKNPEKATEAVMRYLGDLQARFGSWHLALAAFNAGYGAVLNAVAKYNTNDYWELCRHEDGLPWETTLYVPKALAAAIVGENREVFGFRDLPTDPAWDFDRVSVPTSTSLAAIARAAGVPVDQVALLNPELKRARTPPEPWEARVPRGAGPRFAAAFEQHREKVQHRLVRFGERLDDIGRECGASARELKRLNGIDDTAEVRAGLTLLVPGGRAPLPLPPVEAVAIVAVRDKDLVVPGKKRVFYRALPSDTPRDVAAFFRVAPGDLARWNSLDGDARFTSRMVLQLFVAPDFDEGRAALLDPARVRVVSTGSEEFFDLVEARRGRKRIAYTVKAGDTLKRIGARHDLTEGDMERINRFGRKIELKAGQKVTVYVAMSATERAAAERALTPSIAEAAPDDDDDDVKAPPEKPGVTGPAPPPIETGSAPAAPALAPSRGDQDSRAASAIGTTRPEAVPEEAP
ncbi:MAG: LysM peptidoglycan-binding domain-containing protein [Myxococcales bacterium]|nr:LysM peptidoglycan-binding domain-containing protein [Myxococcales bacterium]